MYLAKHRDGNCVRVASLSVATEDAGVQQLLDAFLGVEVKRKFSSGHYQHRFEQMKPLLDTITALAYTIEAKDPYTQGHSQAVSRLAARIAGQLELSQVEIEEITLAGILHDVGKIHVPDYLYEIPPPLSGKDQEIMRSHAAWGAKILEPLKVKAIERMVRHHHEAFDGQGYPDRLKGEQIPLGARIICVADAYHAMISTRPYRNARSIEEAVAELRRCRGTQFDPLVLDAFLPSIKDFVEQPRSESAKTLVI
jgi:putative nucleotidyltransferase with HDIG domain